MEKIDSHKGGDESKTQLGRFAFLLKAGFRGANSETDLL